MAKRSQIKKTYPLWQRCLITFLLLVMYRILCAIPTPGVNKDYLNLLISSNTSLGLLNAFTGNNLSSLSIMALNITPYISSTIVVQLLQSSSDVLKRLARGTPKDKKKVTAITLVLTTIFALSQALGMAISFGRDGLLINYNFIWIVTVTTIWTGMALFVAIVGKKIDENKQIFVGRGVSLFLLTNILASFPSNIMELYATFIVGKNYGLLWCAVGIIVLFIMFTIVAFLHESEKRIVVSYTTNIVYENMDGSTQKQILPIKLMPASVMPVVFSSAIFSIPMLIATLTGHGELEWIKYFNTTSWFNPDNMIYSVGCILYVILVFAFSYFYIDMSLNPYEIAEDLQKAGAFIKDQKTNTDTAKYLKKHIYQMATTGAFILCIISIIPFILSGIFGLSKMSFMGTSVLIIVATIIETYKDIAASKIAEAHAKKTGGLFNEKVKK